MAPTPTTYVPPLNKAQRQTLITYLQSRSDVFDFNKWWSSLTKNTPTQYINAGSNVQAIALDYMVVAQYKQVLSGHAMPPEPSGIGAVTAVPGDVGGRLFSDILNSHGVERVGLFIVGAIVIGIGLNAALRQQFKGTGVKPPQIPGPTKVAKKVIKK